MTTYSLTVQGASRVQMIYDAVDSDSAHANNSQNNQNYTSYFSC